MKTKRRMAVVVWVAITVIYIFLIRDSGRSMGAQANSTIENYVEYSLDDYFGGKGLANAAANAFMYTRFNDLEKEYETTMTVNATITVIYVVITYFCFSAITYKKIEQKDGE